MRTTSALKPGSDTPLDTQILEDIAADAPTVTLDRQAALQPLADVMVAAGMQTSKNAARRCALPANADNLHAWLRFGFRHKYN